ncbi:hypothetical protein QFC20_006161 [Naganishia adeliensis]|uniref:Uncharacterized protein n=1 Tax=Naganishia adeliensis TaxID=92952 RepID=A0ACC2VEB5_9TREE|nr:hypothetical protein QFC20_006161 [Naganishia adeliensis]
MANLNNTMFLINYIKVYQATTADAAVPSPERVHRTSGDSNSGNETQSETSGAIKLASGQLPGWLIASCCILVQALMD